MKKLLFFVFIAGLAFAAFATQKKESSETMENPFFKEWSTPFGVPPFDEITDDHFRPAIAEGMRLHKEEIDAIVNNTEAPTFENTLLALDKSGAFLNRVYNVFSNLSSAHTNDSIQAIEKDIEPLLSAHYDDINLNEGLFKRVKEVYEQRENLDLNTEQARLLEKKYKTFVRGGAELPADKKARMREINNELATLSVQFGEHVLKDNNAFKLVIEDEAQLEGLPAAAISAAAATAKAEGQEGKWIFTISRPSLYPFLTYSPNRAYREKLYKGYIMKGDNENEFDNNKIVARTVELRSERAKLFGYNNHAEYILAENMAKNPANVYDILTKVWEKALPVAKNEVADMQAIADKEGAGIKIQGWDWWYYAEKVRQEKYALSEEDVKPYFEVDNVQQGIFALANKLWGISFTERTDLPKYHPDGKVFEVKEADGSTIGIFYTDYFARPSKRGGAWMSSFRKQQVIEGENVIPVITNVCNFPAPTDDIPSLLSLDQVLTMFHEFGHGLHGLLSNCESRTLSGTSVARDFVELPSQIMENWAFEPEMLALYAKHYQTGEVIPNDLVEKINNAAHFNQGFATVEFLAAGLLDMDYHTLESVEPNMDVRAFEKTSMDKYGLIPEIAPRYRSTYFQHIFAGGYSSGYYAYLWAEVLDKDAFDAFKENGLFDQKTAAAFRKYVLSAGGSDDPMTLYMNFRGKEPGIEPLLKGRGLL
ncbi:M3 family metallopeptidase [uncultured Draconibacterium sp.]|uniref:M3 family metallopeptidase n=1 Tax=uncultured Draconibacterium sp. TaxID=1573823 RepID=UPI0025EA9E12|nr:M3 family metallopeptidase [uncultured Draconibacterium sp.]